jgi:hypothetical protein
MAQDYTTYQGDDFIFNILFQDKNEDPLDSVLYYTMKNNKNLSDSQSILQKTVTGGKLVFEEDVTRRTS